jgi:hypothetical protein
MPDECQFACFQCWGDQDIEQIGCRWYISPIYVSIKKVSKVVPLLNQYSMKTYVGVEVAFHVFLTSEIYYGGSSSVRFTPR